ncbi:hypothetical protein AC00_2523 [Escherichia coli 1-250-04_S3_C1]|uniref:Uncharacterized protein n=1 Tax=Escherichia coli 1-250-04_S3_C1 TaxID=1444135 RepID=A0AAN4NT56_ECOLX|nr:hypothetical protein AC00_2523 [Escherichia coli 1-250-04_S3_C1]
MISCVILNIFTIVFNNVCGNSHLIYECFLNIAATQETAGSPTESGC